MHVVWWYASVILELLQRAWGKERQAELPEAHRQVDSSKQRQNKEKNRPYYKQD